MYWDFDANAFTPETKRAAVTSLIQGTDGQIFGCKAVKKDGSERTFCARIYDESFDRMEHGLIVVRELNAAKKDAGYRSIKVDGVKELTIGGETFTFDR